MEKTEISMNYKVKEALQEGETVLWQGKSERFPLVNAGNKAKLTLRWVICAIAFAAVSAGYIALSVKTAGFKPAVELVIVLIFAYLIAAPMLDRKRILKKCTYYVTDKRVMTAVGDNQLLILGRAGLKVSTVPAESGCIHLLLGAAEALPGKKYLVSTFSGVKSENKDQVTGIVLYNVKDTPELRELLH